MSKFIEQIILEHYTKGATTMGKTRTLAFQVSEELFRQIKDYLTRYEQVYHCRLSQKEFVIRLIEQALAEADEEFEAAQAIEDEAEVMPDTEPDAGTDTAPDARSSSSTRRATCSTTRRSIPTHRKTAATRPPQRSKASPHATAPRPSPSATARQGAKPNSSCGRSGWKGSRSFR